MPPVTDDELRARYDDYRNPDNPGRGFVALIDGRVVGTSYAAFGDAGVNLFGGSVLPEARGRGVYRALVGARWEAAVDARNAGADGAGRAACRGRSASDSGSSSSRPSASSSTSSSRAREAGRVEDLELGRLLAEDRPRDQVAAREPEHVAVARVAARDPDALAARHEADQRLEVGCRAPDAGPAVGHPRPVADELLDERRRSEPCTSSVVASTSVSSLSNDASRLPPITSRPSGSCCQ